jgi:hypothetical protein
LKSNIQKKNNFFSSIPIFTLVRTKIILQIRTPHPSCAVSRVLVERLLVYGSGQGELVLAGRSVPRKTDLSHNGDFLSQTDFVSDHGYITIPVLEVAGIHAATSDTPKSAQEGNRFRPIRRNPRC